MGAYSPLGEPGLMYNPTSPAYSPSSPAYSPSSPQGGAGGGGGGGVGGGGYGGGYNDGIPPLRLAGDGLDRRFNGYHPRGCICGASYGDPSCEVCYGSRVTPGPRPRSPDHRPRRRSRSRSPDHRPRRRSRSPAAGGRYRGGAGGAGGGGAGSGRSASGRGRRGGDDFDRARPRHQSRSLSSGEARSTPRRRGGRSPSSRAGGGRTPQPLPSGGSWVIRSSGSSRDSTERTREG